MQLNNEYLTEQLYIIYSHYIASTCFLHWLMEWLVLLH